MIKFGKDDLEINLITHDWRKWGRGILVADEANSREPQPSKSVCKVFNLY